MVRTEGEQTNKDDQEEDEQNAPAPVAALVSEDTDALNVGISTVRSLESLTPRRPEGNEDQDNDDDEEQKVKHFRSLLLGSFFDR